MPASYPGAIKTFTNKADGDVILASHVDDLQLEVVAIETLLGASGVNVVMVAATAANDFIVATGAGAWTKKTLTEVMGILVAATTSAAGIVELATTAETTTGTDTARAVTPAGLAHSIIGIRLVELKIMDELTSLTTGDNKLIFCVPLELNGMNLVSVAGFVTTVATGATLITVQIRNVTDAVDMLSTKITIDATKNTSYTAATPPVIDTTKDDVVTGDLLSVDIDAIGNTTPGKGLGIILGFQLP